MSTRKFDIERVNAALKRAGKAAVTGPRAARAGKLTGSWIKLSKSDVATIVVERKGSKGSSR